MRFAHELIRASLIHNLHQSLRSNQAAQIAATGRPTQAQLDEMPKALRSQDPDISAKVEQPVSLGVFFETDSSIGSAILQNGTYTQDGKTIALRKVVSYVITLVRGKIVLLYLYRDYHSAADLYWVQDESRKWAAELKRLNP